LQSCDGKLQSFERILYKLIVVVRKKGHSGGGGQLISHAKFQRHGMCLFFFAQEAFVLFFQHWKKKKTVLRYLLQLKDTELSDLAKMEVTHHPLLLLQQHGWNLLVSRASNKILFLLKGCQTFCHCRIFC
jgi:hypothetical protein